MTLRLVALASFVLAAGCLSNLGQTENPSVTDPEQITFVEEYGFCAGRCYSELRMSSAGEARVIVRERRDQTLLLDRRLTLDAAETARLTALAADAASHEWAPRYGCPDCVDQGSYELTLRNGDDVQTTVLDPTEHPATFDDLVAALREVLRRERGSL